jgi:hypothetical protein
MDRIIVYPGEIPLDTDLLNTNRNTMIALHGMMSAALGTTTAVDGLQVAASIPPSMTVVVGPGSITEYGSLDTSSYGSLPSASGTALVKMGIMLAPATLTVTAPTAAGTSIVYLVQGQFVEADVDPVVLPYYNASNPALPYLGPGNSGGAQVTVRQQTVTVQLKAGTVAPTGSEVAPAADAGWIGLATIDVAAGQTALSQSNIATAAATRFAQWKLPDLTPGVIFSASYFANGTFTVPPQITRLKVTLIGAGGGGGGSSATNVGGGGGGSGGRGVLWLYGVTPGTQYPITIGIGGTGGTSASNGNYGGTSSFGTLCSALGGGGGGVGSLSGSGIGGPGGTIIGSNLSFYGAQGSDAVPGVARGGDGGGAGRGPGSSNGANGWGGTSWGDGGGGASGNGFSGGTGSNGLVLVEW